METQECRLAGVHVHLEGQRRVIDIPVLDVAGQGVGDADGCLQVAWVFADIVARAHLVEVEQLVAEGAGLVRLGHVLASAHVAVVEAGVDERVVGEGQVGPLRSGGGKAVRQVIVRDEAHVDLHPLVAGVRVVKAPGGERHRQLIPSQAARVVALGIPDLVIHVVRQAVQVRPHFFPEFPDQPHHVVVGLARVIVVPGQDVSGLVGADRVIDQHFLGACRGTPGDPGRDQQAEQLAHHGEVPFGAEGRRLAEERPCRTKAPPPAEPSMPPGRGRATPPCSDGFTKSLRSIGFTCD